MAAWGCNHPEATGCFYFVKLSFVRRSLVSDGVVGATI